MREFNLASFARFVAEELTDNVKEAREMALEAGAQMIQDEAKSVIGTYSFEWPQLAPSTQADREAKGYPANEPLLRTGELRDSITYTIVKPGELAEIGSNSDIAVYQELGTTTIPPRPFLLSSAFYKEREVVRLIKDVVGAAVAGRSIKRRNSEADSGHSQVCWRDGPQIDAVAERHFFRCLGHYACTVRSKVPLAKVTVASGVNVTLKPLVVLALTETMQAWLGVTTT
jgi:HK97 gp10 family phage protein